MPTKDGVVSHSGQCFHENLRNKNKAKKRTWINQLICRFGSKLLTMIDSISSQSLDSSLSIFNRYSLFSSASFPFGLIITSFCSNEDTVRHEALFAPIVYSYSYILLTSSSFLPQYDQNKIYVELYYSKTNEHEIDGYMYIISYLTS